jgi:hypothetical protein
MAFCRSFFKVKRKQNQEEHYRLAGDRGVDPWPSRQHFDSKMKQSV